MHVLTLLLLGQSPEVAPAATVAYEELRVVGTLPSAVVEPNAEVAPARTGDCAVDDDCESDVPVLVLDLSADVCTQVPHVSPTVGVGERLVSVPPHSRVVR